MLRRPHGGSWSCPNWLDLLLVFRSLATPDQQWVPQVCVEHVVLHLLRWDSAEFSSYLQGCHQRAWVLSEGAPGVRTLLFATDEHSDRAYAMAVITEFI